MKSFILALMLLMLSGVSSAWAADSLVWTCAPQQLLMGRWDIDIFKTDISMQAKTSYLHNVAPHVQPFEQKIDLKDSVTGDSVEYLGSEFNFIVYPTKKPLRNPFRGDNTAVAANAVSVRFAPNAILTNRAYACKPQQ